VSSNPRGPDQPAFDPELHPLADPERSLVESLGGIVDDIRQINTDLGARPYRVFSVTLKWSGGEIGRGDAEVVSETEFLPTPDLSSINSVRRSLLSGGNVERGGLALYEISPRYTEDQLDALCYGDRECRGPAFQTFIEVSIDRRDGDRTKRRRFTIAAVPYRDAKRFQWTVDLTKQDGDRKPDGTVQELGERDPFAIRR
jgi:hypothetical protein